MHIKRSGNRWLVLPDGTPPVEPLASDGERRLIWVPAVPSSGTSCVSGILHHLGVNMGKVDDPQNFSRGYQMFEDLDVGLFAYIPNSDQDRLLNQKVRMEQYCNYRIAESPPGRIGVKALPTAWAYCREPERLPVDVLDVRRPLQESIDADQRRMANRPLRDPGSVPRRVEDHWSRASGVAAMSVARDQLVAMHPPKLTLEFHAVLENPAQAVMEICGAFELEPTDEQMDTAVRSVKPKRESQ